MWTTPDQLPLIARSLRFVPLRTITIRNRALMAAANARIQTTENFSCRHAPQRRWIAAGPNRNAGRIAADGFSCAIVCARSTSRRRGHR